MQQTETRRFNYRAAELGAIPCQDCVHGDYRPDAVNDPACNKRWCEKVREGGGYVSEGATCDCVERRTEYNEQICITAGELREMGVDVPDRIPDCVWIPRWSMRMDAEGQEPTAAECEQGILKAKVIITFTQPFQWVSVDFTLKDVHDA